MSLDTRKILSIITLSTGVLFSNDATMPNNCVGPVLCPIAPMEKTMDCCNRFHVDIGLLYQQPSFYFMMPAVKGTSDLPPVNPSADDPENQTADWMFQCFDYAIGLTASLGYFMEHDNWYLGAEFDWLHSNLHKKYSLTDESNNITFQNIPEFYGSLYYNENYNGIWYLQETFSRSIIYNADFELYSFSVLLSRGSYHSKAYSLEPYAAVSALWFRNSQNTTYLNGTNQDHDANVEGYYELKKNNWGVGPMLGLNGEYYFTDTFSLFIDSSIALLYGESSSLAFTNYKHYTDNAHTVLDDDYYTTETFNTNCQYYLPGRSILGLQFSKFCFEDTHYLAVKVGYDVRIVLSYPAIDRGFAMSGLYTNLIWNF